MILFSPLMLVALTAFAADKKSDESGKLKEVVIEGETRIQLKAEKPVFTPDPDPKPPVEQYLALQLSQANPTEKIAISYPTYLPSRVASDVVLSPWRTQLSAPPILYLAIKRPANLTVKEWRLVITDDQGQQFRNVRGKSELPDHVTWDGLGDDGQAMHVGHSYAYSLSTLDNADNPNYLFGKTVRVGAFVDDRSPLKIAVEPDLVFKQGEISPQGQAILREAQDWLRKKTYFSIELELFSADTDLADKEAELARKFLQEALRLPDGKIKAKGKPLDKTGYVRLEITGHAI